MSSNHRMQNSRLDKMTPAIAIALALTACGGGGGGSSGTGASNRAPTAARASTASVNVGDALTLDGSPSTDPDGDALTYRWQQIDGPDVTGGAGFITSISPSLAAPDEVSTLVFELRVNDGIVDSAPSVFTVFVMEDTEQAIFVDGDRGDDATGTGAREAPFATIEMALAAAAAAAEDVYVMSRTEDQDALAYRPAGFVSPAPGVSLYGGFDREWRRNVAGNRTKLWTDNSVGLYFSNVDRPTVLSGFDIKTGLAENPRMNGPYAVLADGGIGSLGILDNTLTSAPRLPQTIDGRKPNYGVLVTNIASVEIRRNTISSGDMSLVSPLRDEEPPLHGNDGSLGADGGSPEIVSGGAGGTSIWAGANGGAGGGGHIHNFGFGLGEPGEDGQGPGGAGGEPSTGVATSGDDGGDGAGGAPGAGGIGDALVDANATSGDGLPGRDGAHGGGGGGGAGGASGPLGEGGGGGGGGSGGQGGFGGLGGSGGGASIAILVTNVAGRVVIDSNELFAGSGGPGGRSGVGGEGGAGGGGGYGALGNGGNPGKNGGNGGAGGRGGAGGAGGGGPSIGIVIGPGVNAEISRNRITTGDGGAGGGGARGGEGGYSIGIADADALDGVAPNVFDNEFMLGAGGPGGAGTASAGSPGQSQALSWE